ncbi:hypothetical protein Aperf_G00000097461 [Anoplocephala perfoliata]
MTGHPTIRPFPSFNADKDAEELRQAMKGMGADEKKIINVLSKRTVAQRKEIASRYSALYERDLKKDLKSELKGNFEDIVLASMLEVPELKASALLKAMKGMSTDEKVLVQVFSVASNQEIQQITQAYKDLFYRNLEKDITSKTSGDFRRILVAILQARRDESGNVDQKKVETDVETLYKCGEGRLGTDEARFTQIFASRSFPHIKEIAKVYVGKYKKTLFDAIKSETSGSYRDILISIVAYTDDHIELYAKWINESMAGVGTRDDDLIRLILSRAEIDLEDIKEAYLRMKKRLLTTAIQNETSGDYKRMLIAIVEGGH